MWESLTIALSCAGFIAAVMLMIAEIPAVFDQGCRWYGQGRRGHL